MDLLIKNLSENDAKEISNWKYKGEYSIYNLPSFEEMKTLGYSLAIEEKRDRYLSFINESNELIGFVNLLDEGDHIFFGIGVNPRFCGKGLGKLIVNLSIQEAKKRFNGKPLVLEVRTWNERAISCYKSQGFKIVEKVWGKTMIGTSEFYVMKYEY